MVLHRLPTYLAFRSQLFSREARIGSGLRYIFGCDTTGSQRTASGCLATCITFLLVLQRLHSLPGHRQSLSAQYVSSSLSQDLTVTWSLMLSRSDHGLRLKPEVLYKHSLVRLRCYEHFLWRFSPLKAALPQLWNPICGPRCPRSASTQRYIWSIELIENCRACTQYLESSDWLLRAKPADFLSEALSFRPDAVMIRSLSSEDDAGIL